MPAKPVLTEADKKEIKNNLQENCKTLWISQGYKKTSIKQLCTIAGISIGTFYSLYSTKEDLFFETAKNIQTQLTEQFLLTVQQLPNKNGFAKAMKELFREYDSKPFLYNVNTPDFQAFITKLPKKAMEELKFENIEFIQKTCRIAKLKTKIDEAKACGILSALLSTIGIKHTFQSHYDYFEIFDFMVDHLISEIFE